MGTDFILSALIPAIIATIAAVSIMADKRVATGRDADGQWSIFERLAPYVALIWATLHTWSTWMSKGHGFQTIIMATLLGMIVGHAFISRHKTTYEATMRWADLIDASPAWGYTVVPIVAVVMGFLTGFWPAAMFLMFAGTQLAVLIASSTAIKADGAATLAVVDGCRAIVGGPADLDLRVRVDRKTGQITMVPPPAAMANVTGIEQRALVVFPEHELEIYRHERTGVVTGFGLMPLTPEKAKARAVAAASGGLMTGAIVSEAGAVESVTDVDDFDWSTVPAPSDVPVVPPAGTSWDF